MRNKQFQKLLAQYPDDAKIRIWMGGNIGKREDFSISLIPSFHPPENAVTIAQIIRRVP